MTLTSVKTLPSESEKQAVLSLFNEFPWTEKTYLVLTEANRLIELSEGRLVIHDMPTMEHQDIVHALVRKFDQWIAEHARGRVYFAPVPIRLWPGKFREPDVFLYLEGASTLAGAAYAPIPDLVVEVLSPSTRRTDAGDKFDEYALAGIREYWQVDPEARAVSIYTLTGERYTAAGIFGPSQIAHSNLLTDLLIRVDELFAS